ncbi:sigma 54-interacting transcriptional regulator [Haliangium sp.]|uniref:sigma 54-interacting transcriptional regulator n=1 Tax=Haliangium sp. TaxID=2663208 RepID=UPI003D105F54
MTEPADKPTGAHTTISLQGAPHSPRERGLVPTLTIAFHPDVGRIGDTVGFGTRLELSRNQPDFSADDGARAPLADPVLSRRPIVLERLPTGNAAIHPAQGGNPTRLDGHPLVEPTVVTAADLDRGVVIEIADRVVLLWHWSAPAVDPGPDLGLVGANDAVCALRRDIERVAPLATAVLIRGESGVGKELVARALHRAGTRAHRPLVSVNMAAVPASTAASELFGHHKGAFTGAVSHHGGYFVQADGGTLFLDEIGETPFDVQAMLLRAIETGEIRPLGAHEPRRVDVQLIAATDTDLQAAVEAGRFRLPLLHRIAGVELVVPPLRARRDDIGRLFIHFLREELARTGEPERLAPPAPGTPTWLPLALMTRLLRHDWPGNVRQLRNLARQVAVANYGEPGFRLPPAVAALLDPIQPTPAPSASPPPRRRSAEAVRRGPRNQLDISDDDLLAALRANRWRPAPTAKALGIARTSLYKLMNQSERIRKARDIPRPELEACAARYRGNLDAMAEALEVSKRGLKLRMTELGINPL